MNFSDPDLDKLLEDPENLAAFRKAMDNSAVAGRLVYDPERKKLEWIEFEHPAPAEPHAVPA